MTATYPAREPFFAHKFVWLLHKAAVASEIGRDAFALLTVIVHTEDAMRYRGAAKFWNSQLVETLGFKKWDQFDACRKKAIESGWLIYVCHGKRMAGEYWVNVPEGYEMVTDDPIESYPGNGYDLGYDAGYKDGYEQGMKAGTIKGRSGVRTGDEQGEPPNPISNPNPNPKKAFSPLSLEIPEGEGLPFESEEFNECWGDWVKHRKEIKKPLTPTAIKQQHKQMVEWGEAWSMRVMRHTMTQGWQGLREPEGCVRPKASRVATKEDLKKWHPGWNPDDE